MQDLLTPRISFQSAPRLAPGGNIRRLSRLQSSFPFQSAPRLAPGGNGGWPCLRQNLLCFNPPPGSRRGETAITPGCDSLVFVSIRPPARAGGKRVKATALRAQGGFNP